MTTETIIAQATEAVSFGYITINDITPSLTNPRKYFEPVAMAELTANIKASGVHQPILVRPLPASRLEDTFASAKLTSSTRPIYEIVAGERRFRATLAAGLPNIPAMIATLTDDQAMEAQVVENLQRQDLTALEEAEGYESLMQLSHINADQVGEKINKSRTYVYGRLKLLDLGQDSRNALKEGLIDASRALLLARIPDSALQLKALTEIVRHNDIRGVMSTREAAEHIRNRYMLKLSTAIFSTKDAFLTDAAACTGCSKRSGANPDIFSDMKGADVCTDPTCFNLKTQAHHAAIRLNAEKSGHDIIDGREALALMPSKSAGIEGFARLDVATDSPTGKTLRKELTKIMEKEVIKPTMLANPHAPGEIIACIPLAQVPELLAKAGKDEAAQKATSLAAAQEERTKERAEDEAANAFERRWRADLLKDVHTQLTEFPLQSLPTPVEKYLLNVLINPMNTDQCKRLAKMLNLGKVAPKEGVKNWADGLLATDVPAAICLVVAFLDTEYRSWLPDQEKANEGLFMVARQCGIEPDSVRELVMAQIREEKAAEKEATLKAAQGDLPLDPAAQANGVRGGKNKKTRSADATAKKPKLSADDAMQGIANALQHGEKVLGDCAQDQSQCASRMDEQGDRGWPFSESVASEDLGGNEGEKA